MRSMAMSMGMTRAAQGGGVAGFDAAAYGTATGYWEADDYAAGTAANKIVTGSPYGALNLDAGSVVESATGWNGVSKTLDIARLSASRLKAVGSAATRFTIAHVMDITDVSNAGIGAYAKAATYFQAGSNIQLRGGPWSFAVQEPTIIVYGYYLGVAAAPLVTGRQIWIFDRFVNGVANTLLYVNGVARVDAGLNNPYMVGATLDNLWVGNASTGSDSGDQRWKATLTYTNLTSSVAALSAALATYYSV